MSKQSKARKIVTEYLNTHGDVALSPAAITLIREKTKCSPVHARRMVYIVRREWRKEQIAYSEDEQPSPKPAKSPPIGPPPIVFSAATEGRIMSMDEYCEFYNLPREDVAKYKLVTHTAIPFYNTEFREKTLSPTVDVKEFEEIITQYIKPKKTPIVTKGEYEFQRLVFTDVHIGMDPSGPRTMFDHKWYIQEQDEAFRSMARDVIANGGKHLFIDDLGDYMDGWNATTTRGGHDLPQNMDNREAFKQGLKLKRFLADILAPHFESITFNNVCNDNHSSDYGFTVNEAFKQIMEIQHSHIKVSNHERFMSHYFIGDRAFVICHGKDEKEMKFGLKIQTTDKIVNKIEEYIRVNELQKKASSVEFSKGDSHQALLDMGSSDVFDYFNYPALSPSSNYVGVNFKKGRRGYFNFLFDSNTNKTSINPTFL
jgi:hypothetical protein